MHGASSLVPMLHRAWLQLRNIIFQGIGAGKENGLSVSGPVTSWHAPEPRDTPLVNVLRRREQKRRSRRAQGHFLMHVIIYA